MERRLCCPFFHSALSRIWRICLNLTNKIRQFLSSGILSMSRIFIIIGDWIIHKSEKRSSSRIFPDLVSLFFVHHISYDAAVAVRYLFTTVSQQLSTLEVICFY